MFLGPVLTTPGHGECSFGRSLEHLVVVKCSLGRSLQHLIMAKYSLVALYNTLSCRCVPLLVSTTPGQSISLHGQHLVMEHNSLSWSLHHPVKPKYSLGRSLLNLVIVECSLGWYLQHLAIVNCSLGWSLHHLIMEEKKNLVGFYNTWSL